METVDCREYTMSPVCISVVKRIIDFKEYISIDCKNSTCYQYQLGCYYWKKCQMSPRLI